MSALTFLLRASQSVLAGYLPSIIARPQRKKSATGGGATVATVPQGAPPQRGRKEEWENPSPRKAGTGLRETDRFREANELLALPSLRDARWIPLSAYSKGMKQPAAPLRGTRGALELDKDPAGQATACPTTTSPGRCARARTLCGPCVRRWSCGPRPPPAPDRRSPVPPAARWRHHRRSGRR